MPAPLYAVALAAALSLGACVPAARTASAPAPLPAPAGEEELGDGPAIETVEVRAAGRDILGGAAYDLPVVANSWVEAELDFLVNERSAVIGRWLERGDFYEPYVKEILTSYGLPTDLYHLAMIESGFVPSARSRAGAVGMWQFMPATGKQMGLRVDSLVDERMDPVRSTHAAARHLQWLHRAHGGDWALATAAYNAGTGRISRGLQAFGATDFWDLAQRGDLAEETRHYVPRLYAMTVIARDRERFGFAAAPRGDGFAYDSMHVEYATPLAELARMSELPADQLARLNPHLLRGTAPADYWVWTPAGAGERMQRAYIASSFRQQQGLGSYTVRSGDSLGRLAERSGVRAARIRELNPKVDFDRLKVGETLRLPYQAAERLATRTAEPETKVAAAQPAAKAPAAKAPAARTAGAPAKAEPRTHTVESGESLWGIARRYGLEVSEVQKANKMSGTTIRAGQKLTIPSGGRVTVASAPVQVQYVVQSGDSLWSIARRHGSSVDAIQSANSLGERPIVPGQKLTIPQ